jgi:hypothetical protein
MSILIAKLQMIIVSTSVGMLSLTSAAIGQEDFLDNSISDGNALTCFCSALGIDKITKDSHLYYSSWWNMNWNVVHSKCKGTRRQFVDLLKNEYEVAVSSDRYCLVSTMALDRKWPDAINCNGRKDVSGCVPVDFDPSLE